MRQERAIRQVPDGPALLIEDEDTDLGLDVIRALANALDHVAHPLTRLRDHKVGGHDAPRALGVEAEQGPQGVRRVRREALEGVVGHPIVGLDEHVGSLVRGELLQDLGQEAGVQRRDQLLRQGLVGVLEDRRLAGRRHGSKDQVAVAILRITEPLHGVRGVDIHQQHRGSGG